MLTITMRTNFAEVRRDLDRLRADQIPFATMLALNRVATKVKVAEVAEMRAVFDRPTPYTLNSLFLAQATKEKLEARVWVKDERNTAKGTPAVKYLLPEIEGGARRLKRFELALQRTGNMPAGYFAVAGQGADLDAFGNMKPSQISAILSYLRAHNDATQNRASTERKKRRGRLVRGGFRYFAIQPGRDSHLEPGIYRARVARLDAGNITPVIIFVAKVHYPKRFKFVEVAERTVEREFAPEFARAARQAMATARPV